MYKLDIELGLDQEKIASYNNSKITFSEKPIYTSTQGIEFTDEMDAVIVRFGRKYFIVDGKVEESQLSETYAEKYNEPIQVYALVEGKLVAVECPYHVLVKTNFKNNNYQLIAGEWQLINERFDINFAFHKAFVEWHTDKRHYMHIEVANVMSKEVIIYVNGKEVKLNTKKHLPIHNINVRKMDVRIKTESQKDLIVRYSNTEYITINDSNLFEKYGITKDPITNLWTSLIKNESTKLLIIFPGFGGQKYRYPISTLRIIDNYNKLIFADVYGNKGSYLYIDNDGQFLIERVKNKISNVIKELGVLEEDIIFHGISKGASAAIYYSKFFPKSKTIAICPQLDIAAYTTKFIALNEFLHNGHRKYKIDFDRENVHIAIAENDYPSNRGISFKNRSCSVSILSELNHREGSQYGAILAQALLKNSVDIYDDVLNINVGEKLSIMQPDIVYAEICFEGGSVTIQFDQAQIWVTDKQYKEILDSKQGKNIQLKLINNEFVQHIYPQINVSAIK